jgi:hypothetical protein
VDKLAIAVFERARHDRPATMRLVKQVITEAAATASAELVYRTVVGWE